MPRTSLPRRCATSPSQGHSAHIGEFVTVHYSSHPLFERRVRCEGVDRSRNGALARVEAAPGHVIIISTWMLDPVACVGMAIGEARVSLSALVELAEFLATHRGRVCSSTVSSVLEIPPDEAIDIESAREFAPNDHGIRFPPDARNEPEATRRSSGGAGEPADGGDRSRREGGAA